MSLINVIYAMIIKLNNTSRSKQPEPISINSIEVLSKYWVLHENQQSIKDYTVKSVTSAFRYVPDGHKHNMVQGQKACTS